MHRKCPHDRGSQSGWRGRSAGSALRLPWIWIINAAITTLIFAVIELTGARFPEKFCTFGAGSMSGPATASWSPLDLPPADGRQRMV
jgi:hypothetical protein